jgi:glycosyltransferase involved in cell wall biosynthesis
MAVPLNILHVITRLIYGGAQKNTVMCCAAQVAAGHRVTLAYGPIYGPEGSLLDEARASGAELVELKWMRRALLPVHDVLAEWELRRVIRQLKPDVVHTHSSKAGIIGRSAAWALRVPAVVHTVHGLPFHERQNPLVHRLYVTAERWAARRCHHMIGITAAMCDAMTAQRIGRPSQFSVIPSGIELSGFGASAELRDQTRRELNIAPDAPVIGIVARLDPLKGQDDLIEVLPAVLAQAPGARLLLVGNGWHRAELESHVQRLNLGDHVIFTGLVPPQRVAAMMNAMDIMALPSYQEGQGRTLVEALLCGCTVVGYAVGGIPEVCVDGVTGRTVPVGDTAKLGAVLVELLGDPAQRRRLNEAGLRHAREHFDARVMVQKVEQVYQDLLRDE